LKKGDRVKFISPHGEFEQAVDSMEVDRKPVEDAGAGDTIGLKVGEKVSEGAVVSKVE
jgi:translation elongation factor EF-1alpha